MKRALDNIILSRRYGYDGWALRAKDSKSVMWWSFCTTRQEARELRREAFPELDFWSKTEVVKVKLDMKVVPQWT